MTCRSKKGNKGCRYKPEKLRDENENDEEMWLWCKKKRRSKQKLLLNAVSYIEIRETNLKMQMFKIPTKRLNSHTSRC